MLVVRRAQARADHDADRVHRADLFHGHLVVLHHDVVAPEVAEVLCVLKGSLWVYVHQYATYVVSDGAPRSRVRRSCGARCFVCSEERRACAFARDASSSSSNAPAIS